MLDKSSAPRQTKAKAKEKTRLGPCAAVSVCIKLDKRSPHHPSVALPASSPNPAKHTNAISEQITYNQHQAMRDTYALNPPTETVMMPGRLGHGAVGVEGYPQKGTRKPFTGVSFSQ
eukprot:g33694.t1